jgi:hypothetical protein
VDTIDCSEAKAQGFIFLSAAFFLEWEMVCGVDFALVCLVGFLEVEGTMVAKVKG